MFKEKIVGSINNILLKLAMLPSGLYAKMGVNTAQLHAILKTKLIIDNRRPMSFKSMGRQRKKTGDTNSSIGTVLISLVFGLMFLYSFAFNGLILQMTIFFSLFIFFLASMLINDFTSVLIDVRDNFIILPKPVNDKTIVLSRMLHIFLHLVKVLVPMLLPGLIAIIINYNIAVLLAAIVMVFFCTLFTVFLINLIYVFILKIVSPAKFKSVLSYLQIFLAIVLYGSFQIFPRYIQGHTNIQLDQHYFVYFIPSYWFSAGVKVLGTFSGINNEIVCTILAVIVPLLALFVVIKFLAPSFNRKLSLINTVNDNQESTTKGVVKTSAKRKSYSEAMAAVFARNKLEKMGFLFSWKIGNRSKDFIMKVYPAFGYVLVMMFVLVFSNNKIKFSDLSHLKASDHMLKVGLLSLIYFTGYILFAVLRQIAFSEKYKAGWLFFTTPVREPGRILLGTFKSIVVKFYLPIALIILFAATYFFGFGLLPNILLGISNVVLVIGINFYSGDLSFPFTNFQDSNSAGGNFLKNFFKMIIMGILGVLQYFIYPFTIVVLILLVLSLIANWMVMDTLKKTSWNKIMSSVD